jgi:hypothetical protein|tara:strand:+ start:1362 stop:2561 length:1200 start_codon:yes stop_codon:yes gene_type:complete
MDVSSHYKKYLNSTSNSKKNTIHIKDIAKYTPIPTAIKLRTPEPIQSVDDCSVFDYPISDIVNTNFANISSTYSKLAVCPYFITTCKNRYGVHKPYIQYLLYKYPSANKKFGNLLVFPFVDVKTNINVKTVANKLLNSVIKIKITPTGFIQNDNTIFVFYNLSSVDEYSTIPRAEQQWLKLIKESNNLWWVLIDEICNHRKSLNFPIHKSVTSLFYQNPILIYLKQKAKNIDIPIVGYYGNYYKFLPIIASLGQKPTTWPNLEFGPYFYFTSYTGAFRYAGWTSNYKQRKVYDKRIANEDGKLVKGGIIRFALFMENTHVLLDMKNSKISKYMHKNEWAKHYHSLYLGRVPRINGSVWHMNPRYVVKTFDQQLPLSLHLADMDSLKDNWDPLYTGYQIE